MQDDASAVTLKTQSRSATDCAVASFQQQHKNAVNQIFAGCDDSLSGSQTLPPSVPVVQMLSNTSLSGQHSLGKGKKPQAGRGGTERKALCEEIDSSFPALKCLKGCRDPVLAASKVRKATMTEFGKLESKFEKVLDVCRETLNLIKDDFDCEDSCDWYWISNKPL